MTESVIGDETTEDVYMEALALLRDKRYVIVQERIGDVLGQASAYQRPLIEARVRQIMKEFSWAFFTPPAVNIRADGSMTIVDAQHRLNAAQRLGHQDQIVACMVYKGLSYSEEAVLWDKLNTGQRKASQTDIFAARLEAREVKAIAIRDIVETAGYTINLRRPGASTGIRATKALMDAYQIGGGENLREALGILNDAWSDDTTLTYALIVGFTGFVRQHQGQYDRHHLIRRVAAFDSDRFQHSASQLKVILGGTDSIAVAVRRYAAEQYNHGLPEGKRLLV